MKMENPQCENCKEGIKAKGQEAMEQLRIAQEVQNKLLNQAIDNQARSLTPPLKPKGQSVKHEAYCNDGSDTLEFCSTKCPCPCHAGRQPKGQEGKIKDNPFLKPCEKKILLKELAGQEGKKCCQNHAFFHTKFSDCKDCQENPTPPREEFGEIMDKWQERVIRELKMLGYWEEPIENFLKTASVPLLLRSVMASGFTKTENINHPIKKMNKPICVQCQKELKSYFCVSNIPFYQCANPACPNFALLQAPILLSEPTDEKKAIL